jgi:uncharacterized protein (TIGR00290 family)
VSLAGSTGPSRPIRTLVSWSSGKDSAWMLGRLLNDPGIEVVGLVSTVSILDEASEASEASGDAEPEIVMHRVPASRLRAQAAAAGLPLTLVELPWPCPNGRYEEALLDLVERQRAERGVEAIAFGDLFLDDIRAYRERLLERSGLLPLFPLWGRDTAALAREMIADGLEATVTAVDPERLDPSFVGRSFDDALLADLPAGVDPCGENGEFHTFVTWAPGFIAPSTIFLGTDRAPSSSRTK